MAVSGNLEALKLIFFSRSAPTLEYINQGSSILIKSSIISNNTVSGQFYKNPIVSYSLALFFSSETVAVANTSYECAASLLDAVLTSSSSSVACSGQIHPPPLPARVYCLWVHLHLLRLDKSLCAPRLCQCEPH